MEPESHLKMVSSTPRLSRSDTIQAMNDFGRDAVPFAFLVSFSGEDNLVLPLGEAEPNGLFIRMPRLSTASLRQEHPAPSRPRPFRMRMQPVGPRLYHDAFEKVLAEIRYG
ncbi:MAG: hypothetical protein EHM46_06475, partial [Bacteroidetes bacterium]